MAKNFSAVSWASDIVLYEVNIRQYTPEGTFNAFAEHIPRLIEMGVNTFWMMPIYPISEKGRKGTLGSYYAIRDYIDVNPEFGTLEDFKALADLIHAHGGKIILDWVANHTGLDHRWVTEYPSAYVKNAQGQFYDRNGWDDVIDLNYYDGGLRARMIHAMEFWIRNFDIDGFRCDMAHLVPLDFWRDARSHLDIIKPLFWLGETETLSYLSVFDSCYAWQWMHTTEKVFHENPSADLLIPLLDSYYRNFQPDTLPLFFTSNHDENSWNGTEYEKYGIYAHMLAVHSFMDYGIPLIYSAQELPLEKRLAFFEKDPIEWDNPCLLHDFYQRLSTIRSTFLPDQFPQRIWLGDELISFSRETTEGLLWVILHVGKYHQRQEMNILGNYRWVNLFDTDEVVEAHRSVALSPGDYKIFLQIEN